MSAHETKLCRRSPGGLIDHTACWDELRRIQRERDELREKLAELRADYVRVTAVVPDQAAAEGEWR